MQSSLPQTSAILESGIEQGLHLGAQIYVSLDGNIVMDHAFGESRAGVAMTTDTLSLWMSSAKPITAVAAGQLWEKGLIDLDDRVSKYIPEFAAGAKDAITIRHILTHTAGFRLVIGLNWADPYERAIETICAAALEPRWVPGETAGYHTITSWYILAEVVRRVDGRRIDQYAREMIFLPLGMSDCWLGMPAEQYRSYGDRIGFVFDTRAGKKEIAGYGNTEEDAVSVRPGANGRGPMNQLGKFYETLMQSDPAPLLHPATRDAMTTRQRIGQKDLTFRHIIDFGLGFIINSNRYGAQTVPYGYGLHAGENTFGHSGQETSCAFCDPDRKLAVAWACNGMPGEVPHAVRQRSINTAIYEDLHL